MTEPRDIYWLRRRLQSIDDVYFDGALEGMGVTIHWAPWKKRKRDLYYGWCDGTKIFVSRALAHHWVPSYVVLATIFHEALHVVVGPDHDSEFAMAEQRFVHHAKAEVWETENHHALLEADNPHKRKK